MPNHDQLYISTPIIGRLRVVKKLAKGIEGFSLDIGCKDVRLGDINIDNNVGVKPDMVADALNLPFRSETFDLVFFTEVTEHLPPQTERLAFSGIFRVLKKGGTLIVTTPSDRSIFKWLDPTRCRTGHRHYQARKIQRIIEDVGFTVENNFTAGGFWELATFLWNSLISYPFGKIFYKNIEYAPQFLLNKVDAEYNKIGNGRCTIFIIAKK